MKHSILLLTFFLIFSFNYVQEGNAQSFKEKNKLALKHLRKNHFSDAVLIYEELLREYPNNTEVHYQLGYCYMNTGRRYRAIEHLEFVVNDYKKNGAKQKKQIQAYRLLAQSYYISYDFESAKNTYEECKVIAKKKKVKEELDKEIKKCEIAQTIYETPGGIMVTDLIILNSEYTDHSPVVSSNEAIVILTEDNEYYEDIYIWNKSLGVNSEPIRMDTTINTIFHEATCGLSNDGTELFIFQSDHKNKGNIYVSNFENDKWSKPIELNDEINTNRRESHASTSNDNNFLYFTSDRKGGYGGMDIYIAERSEDNNWTNVKNLGPTINTEEDEEGPFISMDGSTLYFCSKGHEQTMGGFDVYSSKLQENGKWSEPKNMGFPLNTVDDDKYFVPTANPNRAYYTSYSQNGSSNIYLVDIFGDVGDVVFVKGFAYDSNIKTKKYANKDVKISGNTTTIDSRIIKEDKTINYNYNDSILITDRFIGENNVTVTDSLCKIPYGTKIIDYIIQDKMLSNVYVPQKKTGKYFFVVYPIGEHLVVFKADGHIYDLNFLPTTYPGDPDIFYKAEMDTMIRGKIKHDKYSPFIANSNELSERQELELEILSEFIQQYDSLFVNIATTSRLNTENELDIDRKNVVINYLLGTGLSPDRITTRPSKNKFGTDTLEYTIYDTKEELIAVVDTIEVVEQVDSFAVVMVTNILFEINQHTTNKYDNTLNTLAEYIIDNKDAKVLITGFTDTQGPSNYNKNLSTKRANFVKNELIKKGVNTEQIETKGGGYTKQIAINKNKKGEYIWDALEYNRRVEIQVVTQGENSKLLVKQIEVPAKYAVEGNTVTGKYSIHFFVSETKTDISEFNMESVKEYIGSDGLYNYYFGEYENQEEAQKTLVTLKEKYPDAFIFVNDF